PRLTTGTAATLATTTTTAITAAGTAAAGGPTTRATTTAITRRTTGGTTRTALRIIGTPARTTTARVSPSATRGRARRFGSGSDQFSEKWNFCAASLLSGSRKNFL